MSTQLYRGPFSISRNTQLRILEEPPQGEAGQIITEAYTINRGLPLSTIEQSIVDSVISRLKTMHAGDVVNVYGRDHEYTVTVKDVHDHEQEDFKPSHMPCINVYTPKNDTRLIGSSYQDRVLQLIIILYITDAAPPPLLRDFIADVFACIGSDENWGIPEVMKTDNPSYSKDFMLAGQSFGSAHVSIDITYRARLWQM